MPGRPTHSRRRRIVNPTVEYERLMTVLAREVERLMDASWEGRLPIPDGKLLLDYIKFVADLKAVQDLEKIEIDNKDKKV